MPILHVVQQIYHASAGNGSRQAPAQPHPASRQRCSQLLGTYVIPFAGPAAHLPRLRVASAERRSIAPGDRPAETSTPQVRIPRSASSAMQVRVRVRICLLGQRAFPRAMGRAPMISWTRYMRANTPERWGCRHPHSDRCLNNLMSMRRCLRLLKTYLPAVRMLLVRIIGVRR